MTSWLLIQGDPPLIECYLDLEAQLQTNGFDLSLRSVSFSPRPENWRWITVTASSRSKSNWISTPMECCISPRGPTASLYEIVHLLKDIMALGLSRSSLLRNGASYIRPSGMRDTPGARSRCWWYTTRSGWI